MRTALTSTSPGRCLLTAAVGVAALAGCTATDPGRPTDVPGTPTTAASPTTTPAGGPVITAFHVIADITCTGSSVPVPASWSTRGAQTVSFTVDGQAPGAGAGYPVSGSGNIAVPCDNREHEVVIVASAGGSTASRSAHVNTSNGTPSGGPVIDRFQVLDDVTCPGGVPFPVAASWTTRDAQSVSFAVDGQPLPAAAGFPTSGAGNIPVNCDGRAHKVTITGTGTANRTASLSRSVNTTPFAPTPPITPTTR